MERSLKVKRIYAVGQYQNIEFTDEINGVPEEFALNESFISKLSTLQLLGLEIKINKYYILRTQNAEKSPEEIIAILEQERTELLNDILDKKENKHAIQ